MSADIQRMRDEFLLGLDRLGTVRLTDGTTLHAPDDGDLWQTDRGVLHRPRGPSVGRIIPWWRVLEAICWH